MRCPLCDREMFIMILEGIEYHRACLWCKTLYLLEVENDRS